MKYLAIDTTADKLTIVLDNGQIEYQKVLETAGKKHNSALLPLIDGVLAEGNVSLNDMDFFGVVTGPGSFTGIRVGIATVNAFAAAIGKKVVSMSSLEGAFIADDDILALLDCKHNNYYAALKEDGEMKYFAISGDEIPSFGKRPVYLEQYSPATIHYLMKSKIKDNIFSDKAQAFYIKQSSAER